MPRLANTYLATLKTSFSQLICIAPWTSAANMTRYLFSVLCALCILASMLVVSASAACSMVKYPRQFIKPARNEDGQWLFASYAQTRVDAGISIKTCLNKCKKDSSTKFSLFSLFSYSSIYLKNCRPSAHHV